ncbi:hypothetical protein QJS66_18245 [Kocuria rhizophila]|nr:hypothetical protein QJS66_18245 [Kocuria rhizophila]
MGYDEGGPAHRGGAAPPAPRRRLDEVEKATPVHILLQVLDDGRRPTARAAPWTSAT